MNASSDEIRITRLGSRDRKNFAVSRNKRFTWNHQVKRFEGDLFIRGTWLEVTGFMVARGSFFPDTHVGWHAMN